MLLMTIGASPRLISSNRMKSGFDISARPIAHICCWPPDIEVDGWFRRSFRTGNSVVDGIERPAALPPELAADQQVLLDRERGEETAALGHQRDAAAEHLVGAEPADRLAVEADRVAARGQDAGHAR